MAKERTKFQRKVDAFFRSLFFEENGKPKSASFLYAFLIALAFTVIYAAAYLLLLGPLEQAFSSSSVAVRNLAEYILPALAGSALCLLPTFSPARRRPVARAYVLMAVLLVLVMLFELFLVDRADFKTEYGLFLAILGFPALACVLTGGIPALLLVRRDRKAEEKSAPRRRSWYNT